jgi:uracil-DNA glycosylase
MMMTNVTLHLATHQQALARCTRCPEMIGPVVVGAPAVSRIIQIGQAPGPNEGKLGRPFAWTAGKTLFKWYETLGVSESDFRERVYMAAVCRCFPGKNPKGGDRVPNLTEVANCAHWLQRELAILQPELLIPVGKLAIAQLFGPVRLDEVVGRQHGVDYLGRECEVIPLPHPSGLSTWYKTEPGKHLLQQALQLIARHPTWCETFHPQVT